MRSYRYVVCFLQLIVYLLEHDYFAHLSFDVVI